MGLKRHGLIFKIMTVLCLALCVSAVNGLPMAFAAETKKPAKVSETPVAPNAQKLMLSADQLIYDRDHQKITAEGAVQINYNGYKMVSRQLDYNQSSGRLTATGDIELVSPDGTRLYADTMDVTDDFGQGFVNALRIESTNNTRFAAESGERINANQFVLHNGVYTACLPCADHPERAPLWQLKARKVVQDGQTHMIHMENASFELFGMPVLNVPAIDVPDQTVKRKSGFLMPYAKAGEKVGLGISLPYYYVLSPSMDATVTGTYYTSQGAMLEGEFRQRFDNGWHTVNIAAINQNSPNKFDAGTSDTMETKRAAISTRAEFQLNNSWIFGWDAMVQTDNNFGFSYSLITGSDYYKTNQIYLKGLGNRNYFDLRTIYFDMQDGDPLSVLEHKQAIVRPVLDYHYIHPAPVMGGELSATMNLTSLQRDRNDYLTVAGFNRFRGLAGDYSRLTTELEWKRQIIAPGGLVLTPLLAARADGYQLNLQNPSSLDPTYTSFETGSSATRTMLTAGLEARYPIEITAPGSNHLFEPIAQIFARPDEQSPGSLPNDDAQSFVFDATNLFERDKFAGFDRTEGGTRANVGFRYTGTFDNGFSLHGIFGQSYQISGKNSFASTDLVNAGKGSGLDKPRSDYVSMVSLQAPNGFSATQQTRFDASDFTMRRTDTTLAYSSKRFTGSISYMQSGAQPAYGLPEEGREVTATTKFKVQDYWSIFGNVTYDISNKSFTQQGIGVAYDDECTNFSLGFSKLDNPVNLTANSWKIGARLSFRTLGDLAIGSGTQ